MVVSSPFGVLARLVLLLCSFGLSVGLGRWHRECGSTPLCVCVLGRLVRLLALLLCSLRSVGRSVVLGRWHRECGSTPLCVSVLGRLVRLLALLLCSFGLSVGRPWCAGIVSVVVPLSVSVSLVVWFVSWRSSSVPSVCRSVVLGRWHRECGSTPLCVCVFGRLARLLALLLCSLRSVGRSSLGRWHRECGSTPLCVCVLGRLVRLLALLLCSLRSVCRSVVLGTLAS